MLNFLNDSMNELKDRYVNLHGFHSDGYHIDQRNRNEQIQDEFYYTLDRYVHLKKRMS